MKKRVLLACVKLNGITLGWLPDFFYAVAMVIQSGFTREAMILKFCLRADNYFNILSITAKCGQNKSDRLEKQ